MHPKLREKYLQEIYKYPLLRVFLELYIDWFLLRSWLQRLPARWAAWQLRRRQP